MRAARSRKWPSPAGRSTTFAEPIAHQGATWAADDTIIIGSYAAGLQRVSAGGAVAVLTQTAPERGESAHAWPEMLPGGRAVLFTVLATKGGLTAAQVAVLDLATGTSTVLVRGGSHAHYVSSGHLVYAAGETLKAVPFDLASLTLRGTPVTVLPHLLTKPTGGGQFDVAADGTLAYMDATPRHPRGRRRWCGWIGRAGKNRSRRPRAPIANLACRPTGRGWPSPCQSQERALTPTSGVGSRTPKTQPADTHVFGLFLSSVDAGGASSDIPQAGW